MRSVVQSRQQSCAFEMAPAENTCRYPVVGWFTPFFHINHSAGRLPHACRFRQSRTSSVPLPRERFRDIPLAKIDSPTRQPLCPGRPAVAAALHFAEHPSTPAPTVTGRRVGCTCIWPTLATEAYSSFATSAMRAPQACRTLSAPGFAVPWRTACEWISPLLSMPVCGDRNRRPGQVNMNVAVA
jgi:hypothetical protein